ncbi:MAG: hypothetical protein AAGF48_01035 [Pseudomonadota bacterium]
MKKVATGLLAFLALQMGAAFVSASAAGFPNLVGEWHGTYKTLVYHEDGIKTGEASMVMVVSRQEDEFIFATHTWKLQPGHAGQPDVAGEAVRGGDETLVGVFNFNRTDVTLLETHDNGTFELDVVGDNVMEGIYHEQGHHEATIFRVRLTRKQ